MKNTGKAQDQPEFADGQEEIIDLTDRVNPSDLAADRDSGLDAFFEADDIIELTDRVAGPPQIQADDGIIELLEVVTPGIAGKQTVQAEEDIIELTDRVTEPWNADDADDGILDLLEVVEPKVAQAQAVQADEEIIELTEAVMDPRITRDDDGVIDLLEVVQTAQDPDDTASFDLEPEPDWFDRAQDNQADPAKLFAQTDPPAEAETNPPAVAFAQAAEDEQEQEAIIQLGDVLGRTRPKDPALSEDIRLDVDETLTNDTIAAEADDTAGVLGMEMEDIHADEWLPYLSAREIENTIERIIQRKCGATIETLVARAVERAVNREIEDIRRSFLDANNDL